MAKEVTKYLWRDYGEPFPTAWQITLTADEAVAFLAMVCVLITYTQTRTWSLARKAVIRVTRPIQLPDSDGPYPLSRLSQHDAISQLPFGRFLWLRKRRSTLSQTNDMTTTSPLFGIAAVVNITLFIIMGVLIPWFLTGGLQTPVVQSYAQHSDLQLLFEGLGHAGGRYIYTTKYTTSRMNLYFAIENYFQWGKCWRAPPQYSQDPCPRRDGPILDRPPLRVTSKPAPCLTWDSSDESCLKHLATLRLDHENLTLRDYGINIDSALRHSRRLTCSPLENEINVFVVNHHPGSPRDQERKDQLGSARGEALREPTTGINGHSQGTPNLTFETSIGWNRSSLSFECRGFEILYDYFRYRDGEPAFVVFEKVQDLDPESPNGHGQIFAILIEDEMRSRFIAHRYSPIGSFSKGGYGIARCQEQHRICRHDIPDGECTEFGHSWKASEEMFELLQKRDPDFRSNTAKEFRAFHDIFYKTSIVALLGQSEDPNLHAWTTFEARAWTMETTTWFEGAIMLTRLNLHAILTGLWMRWEPGPPSASKNLTSRDPGATPVIYGEYIELLLQRSLFLDSDYTNINFFRLMMTLLAMLIIHIASWWPECKQVPRRTGRGIMAAFRETVLWLRRTRVKLSLVFAVALSSITNWIRTAGPHASRGPVEPDLPLGDQRPRRFLAAQQV